MMRTLIVDAKSLLKPRACFLLLCPVLSPCLEAAGPPPPPRTRVEVVADRMHGVDIPDPYRWLEDQDSPETRAWIAAQNSHTRTILDAVSGRAALRTALEKLSRAEFQSPPRLRNGRYFYLRRSAEQDQPVIIVREGANGKERVLVDPNQHSSDGSVSALIWDVTPDGSLLAWARRKGGEDEFEVLILDVETGKTLADGLPRGMYVYFYLLPDKSGFLYTRRRAEGTRVLEHRFRTPVSSDRVLFGTGIPDDQLISAAFSGDGRYVAAFAAEGAGEGSRTRVYLLDRSKGGGFQPLITDIDANFYGAFGAHTLYLRTTWNSPRGRLLAINMENPASQNWREVIPESGESVLAQVLPAGHRLLVTFRQNVSTRLALFESDGKLVRDIPQPTLGTCALVESASWEVDEAFFWFESIATPRTVYRYHIATEEQAIWSRPNIPLNSDAIATTQAWFQSKDGTRVPMFLAMKKGLRLDANRPVLLTGYGGYGMVSTPRFSAIHALWVNHGGIVALANIRGGGEFGEQWHRDGMLDKKQNSFDDFVAAAEWLIAHKYTRPDRLAIQGASNGGMLVAVAAMQRPGLFRAVISRTAHLDMLRFHKFMKAAPWVREYGNPEVAEEFAYLRKYSPYHNVRDGVRYPAMLFTTGDADTRVAPLHSRKMAARVQAATHSGLPVLLRYSLTGGHLGAGSMSQTLDEQTDEMAFLYWQLGARLPK